MDELIQAPFFKQREWLFGKAEARYMYKMVNEPTNGPASSQGYQAVNMPLDDHQDYEVSPAIVDSQEIKVMYLMSKKAAF